MSLPKLKLESAPAWQKERLSRWARAWELDRDLRAADLEEPCGTTGTGDSPVTLPVSPVTNEPAPEPGQIRLFSPGGAVARDRVLYAAVLGDDGNGLFTVAPYGRFSEPCVPGELLTHRDAPGLAVLCLWNAVTVPAEILMKSWVVASLAQDELVEIRIVKRHVSSAQALPDELARRVGPPLWHPADPRRQYLAEERRVMESLLDESGGTTEYPTLDPAWPIAADPHDPYGAQPEPE